MKIALCDDNKKDLTMIEDKLKEHSRYPDMTLYLFESGTELYEKCNKIQFDIILLDIQMPKLDGFTLAKKIKKSMPSTLIIFLTDTMEYTIQGYEVAFRYIPKSRISDLLFSSLDAAIEQISSKFFYFKFNQNTYSILTSDIIYCEVKNHITHLHTVNDSYELREPISSIFQRLSHSVFAIPHRSYIVNFSFIRNITDLKIILNTGATLPISRRYYDEFTSKLYHFARR